MNLNYVYITIMFLYASGSVRKLYKKQLRGLRPAYKFPIVCSLLVSASVLILIIDVFTSELSGTKTSTLFSPFQYEYLLPICIKVLPDMAYIGIVSIFYVISVTVVDTTVYESVDCYVKNYESDPKKITFMCFSILSQGLLLSIGYFSLFITLIKLTTWKAFEWDDSGFLLVISSILAGAMKFPKRSLAKWNDLFLNSYAIFLSIKTFIFLAKCLTG